ncbi:MAG: TonB-dependent receptor plug domain-containing protein [Bacteroidales bacterium]|nr:TonB-dependent receptor plug domain-containing protein [Bacteroidales bacterium]
MHKNLLRALLPALLPAFGAFSAAAQAPADSLEIEQLQEVVIGAVRAAKDAPYAVANISRRELQDFSVTGIELPMLFARTPGVLAWSENGVGTGTSYMRIRGTGGSRINVTLDGVPLNSPEDQTVFWANMNSYGALMGSVQIQRGVGASTNGDGAFGGTIALGTKAPALVPTAEVNASYGSWNTMNLGINASTGLLFNHLILEGGYHQTSTDGYLHGTDGRSGNWYGAFTWLGRDWKLSYKLLGNFENTGQAWNGVVAGNDDLSLMDGTYGVHNGIKTYADLYDAGLGLYNSLYERLVIKDGQYYLLQHRMLDGTYWPRTTDNFWQTHHILNFAWDINPYWKLSVSPHYTHGYGYYEEFRYQNKFTKFGLQPYVKQDGVIVKRSDFVRQKGLTQDAVGLVANVDFRKGDWDVTSGVSVQQFAGNHFGYLTYIGIQELTAYGAAPVNGYTRQQYYDSDAAKTDASGFVKASYALNEAWSVFGDLQFRHVAYWTNGYNDKYYVDENGIPQKHFLDVDVKYNFFNPKAGVNFQHGGHRAYASFAMSHREPERNNFTDNGKYPFPRAEQLLDWEAGYQWSEPHVQAGVNLYYMRYKDQLVQTGELSDIGEALTTNIPDSYRLGWESYGHWDATSWLSLDGNSSFSLNRLLDFDEYVEDWDNGIRKIHYDSAPLAYSPAVILNRFVTVHFGGFQAVWHTNFVSRMFLDNTGNKDRSLPGYSLSDLRLSYTLKPRRVLREIIFGVDANNLFSARVAQSGWVYSAICDSYGHPDENRYYQIGFIPVAPLTVLGHITLRF